MEAIREIVSVGMLTPVINLPWEKDVQVEITIKPVAEEKIPRKKIPFEKLEGCLKEYANPALWEEEQYAWENHVVEKYG